MCSQVPVGPKFLTVWVAKTEEGGHLGHYCSVGRVQSSHGGNSGETTFVGKAYWIYSRVMSRYGSPFARINHATQYRHKPT